MEAGDGYSMNEASRWGGGMGAVNGGGYDMRWKRNVYERADVIPNTC